MSQKFPLPSGLYFSACLGILFLSNLCTCCSHFFWYCLISFTMFSAPVFPLIHWFFSLSNFVIHSKCLKNSVFLLVCISVPVLAVHLYPSSVRVVATFSGTVLFPLLYSVLLFFPPLFFSEFNETWILSTQIFGKWHMKFYENPPSGSRVFPYRRTDMMKLIVALRTIANAPTNESQAIQKFLCLCLFFCSFVFGATAPPPIGPEPPPSRGF